MAHSNPTPRHALLTGGGTGGHIFPALSVGDALQDRGWKVSYAGSPHGPEARLVPRHGLPFHPLAARPVLGRGLVGKARAALTLARSAWQARALVRRLEVDVLLGTGGYSSAPAVLGARLAGRPVVVLEPNAGAGLANRTLSRWARVAAVNYPQTVEQLKCPAEVTGAPVRRAFFDVAALTDEAARQRPHLLVLGGSQGAQQLNRLVPAAVAQLPAACTKLRITHQCGERNLAEAQAAYREAGLPEAQVVPFIEDMAGAMAEATLIVSRAGALTLAEICAAGRPSLLVPLSAAQAHQRDNARVLEEAGAARVMTAEEDFASLLTDLLADPAALVSLGQAARSLARPNAAEHIADLMAQSIQHGQGSPGGAA